MTDQANKVDESQDDAAWVRGRGITVAGFYLWTWRALIVLVAALAIASEVARWWVVLASGILCLLLLMPRRMSFGDSRIMESILYFGVPAALAGNAFLGYGSHNEIVTVVVELLLAGKVVMLSERSRPTRYWIALLSGILIGLGALIVSDVILSYLLFLAYLGVTVYNLNAAKLYFLARGTREFYEPLPVSYLGQLTRSFPPAIVVGAMIFFALPRMRAMGIDLGLKTGSNQVGFTESISLTGEGGGLGESSRIAMWLSASRANPADQDWLMTRAGELYIRGNTMEGFDGVRWAGTSRPRGALTDSADTAHARFRSRETRSLEVFMEPNRTKSLMWPGVLLRLTAPPALRPQLQIDSAGNVTRRQEEFVRYSYSVMVSPPEAAEDAEKITVGELRESLERMATEREPTEDASPRSIDPWQIRELTSVPASITNADWFKEWQDEVGMPSSDEPVLSVLNRLERHFRRNFRMTLANSFSDGNTLKAFVTVDRAGHCEYFVSAAASWLRSVGIGTRAVAGYRGGVWNPVSGTVEIPERNAHAWLEVYIPGSGWITFEPSPGQNQAPSFGYGMAFRQYMNAASFWFNRYVINYDYSAQRDILRAARNVNWRPRLEVSSLSLDENAKELLIIGVLFGVSLWLGSRVVKRRIRQLNVPFWYLPFMRKMRKHGFPRMAGETYRSWHERLVDAGYDENLIQKIDAALEQEIYGGKEHTRIQIRQIKRVSRSNFQRAHGKRNDRTTSARHQSESGY